jgi:hypothetical protein
MTSDIDIFRSANVLIRLHGEAAPSKPPSVFNVRYGQS